jgi:hypothetical protein
MRSHFVGPPLLANDQRPKEKAPRRFPGHRARFSYDDLLRYLVMIAGLTFFTGKAAQPLAWFF